MKTKWKKKQKKTTDKRIKKKIRQFKKPETENTNFIHFYTLTWLLSTKRLLLLFFCRHPPLCSCCWLNHRAKSKGLCCPSDRWRHTRLERSLEAFCWGAFPLDFACDCVWSAVHTDSDGSPTSHGGPWTR